MINIRIKISLLITAMLCITLFSCSKMNEADVRIDISSMKTIKDYDNDTLVDDIESLNYGKYPKDDVTAKKIEPIEWLILENDEENKKVLLMSKYIIDSEKFNKENSYTTWEKSSIRKWLNDTFYQMAFTEKERERIVEVEVLNKDSVENLTIAGNDTRDYIFLLSIEESNKYFNNITDNINGIKLAASYGTYFARQGKKTKYNTTGRNRLKVMQDYNFTDNTMWGRENHYYWLRSIGNEQDKVMVVKPNGTIDIEGTRVNSQYIGIRPCMWVAY